MRNVVFSMWLLVAVGVAVMLAPFVSCSPRVYPTTSSDSTRVEIRERLIRDTAFVEVPKVIEKNIVRDTVSHLENDWAESDASVDTLGFLHHSLSTRPRVIKVPVTVTVHDTTVVEKSSETIVQQVNVLTKAQQVWIRLGKVLSVGLFLLAAVFVALWFLKFMYGRKI